SQVIEGIAISPDGRWLAFDSDRQGNQDIYRMPAAGGDPVQLTTSPDDEFVSSWSGDGREIALHAYHGGGRVVRIVPSEGGGPRAPAAGAFRRPFAAVDPAGVRHRRHEPVLHHRRPPERRLGYGAPAP